MVEEPEKQEEIEAHPDWKAYLENKRHMKALRPLAEAGDEPASKAIEKLEADQTELAERIGKDLDLVNANPPVDKNGTQAG